MGDAVDLTAQAAMLAKGMTPDKLASGWFSPSNPIPGIAPPGIGVGRVFDFSTAWNSSIIPRSAEGGMAYSDLRMLADSCDYVNIAIQTVLDRLCGANGRIVDRNGDPRKPSAKAQMVNEWVQCMDGVTPLHDFMQRAAYDMCVIDAGSAFVDKAVPGKPQAYNIDGASVLPFIDERGRISKYGQLVRGQVAHHYTIDQIIFFPKNRRPHKVYGFSFVNQVASIVTLALKRTARQLDWFTRGNIPDVLIMAPTGWASDQIRDAQKNWAKQLAGISGQNQAKWLPHDAEIKTLDRNPAKDEFDEWLIRVICYAFSLPPTAFVKETNRATAQTTQDASVAEGHKAMLRWMGNFIEAVVNSAWGPGFRWEWDLTDDPSPDDIIKLLTIGAIKPAVCLRLGFREEEIEAELPARAAPQSAPANSESNNGERSEKQGSKGKEDEGNGAQAEKAQDSGKDAADDAPVSNGLTISNADGMDDGLSEAGQALDNLLNDYLDDLRQDAIDGGTKVFKSGETFELSDSPDFALKASTHIGAAYGEGAVANGVEASAISTIAREWAKERAAWLVGMRVNEDGDIVPNPNKTFAISDVCRDSIRAKISQGLEEGITSSKLAEQIAADHSFSPERARKIAHFETANAQEEGKQEAWKRTGVDYKEWSDFDGCPVCVANAAVGAIPVGQLFPSGHAHAPAHPHCKCTTLAAKRLG